ALRLGDDVDAAEQGSRDPPQLVHLPVGPDTPAVALEAAAALLERLFDGPWLVALVAPVGQQDRVADRRPRAVEGLPRHPQPHAHRGAAGRLEPVDGAARLLAGDVVGNRHAALPWIGRSGVPTAGDDGELHAVPDALHRDAGCLT